MPAPVLVRWPPLSPCFLFFLTSAGLLHVAACCTTPHQAAKCHPTCCPTLPDTTPLSTGELPTPCPFFFFFSCPQAFHAPRTTPLCTTSPRTTPRHDVTR